MGVVECIYVGVLSELSGGVRVVFPVNVDVRLASDLADSIRAYERFRPEFVIGDFGSELELTRLAGWFCGAERRLLDACGG